MSCGYAVACLRVSAARATHLMSPWEGVGLGPQGLCVGRGVLVRLVRTRMTRRSWGQWAHTKTRK